MSIPYDIIKEKKDSRSSSILEGIYHKGQDKIWNGNEVLSSCINKYGEINLPKDKLHSLNNIFSVILWGELAAWKISAALAQEIDSIEAKLAATSQAHDEARHFYVMRDYLSLTGIEPVKINSATETLLTNILKTKSLAKKLLGMQLMVEPVAITIFRFVRESNVEPILSELLSYYEKDEARHIALGVQYLPKVIKTMSWGEKLGLILFQMRLLSLEVEGLKALEKDFKNLNINPDEVFKFAEKKQLDALELLSQELGLNNLVWTPIVKVMNFQKNIAFSDDKYLSAIYNSSSFLRKILLGTF